MQTRIGLVCKTLQVQAQNFRIPSAGNRGRTLAHVGGFAIDLKELRSVEYDFVGLDGPTFLVGLVLSDFVVSLSCRDCRVWCYDRRVWRMYYMRVYGSKHEHSSEFLSYIFAPSHRYRRPYAKRAHGSLPCMHEGQGHYSRTQELCLDWWIYSCVYAWFCITPYRVCLSRPPCVITIRFSYC
jgi:hypothetical protein